MENKSIIIGGDFGYYPKPSSIVKKLSESMNCDVVNGGTIDSLTIDDLTDIKLSNYDLIVWMANVSNGEEKHYPIKKKGCVLICSKLIHDDVTDLDAISRIFKMNGNAVISIRTVEKPFSFKLIDALGNVWCDTTDLNILSDTIKKFYDFTKNSIRYETVNISNDILDLNNYKSFITLNKLVADKSESMGGRYFGNCSTRCDKMFPSVRSTDNSAFVSRRNVNKSRITVDDLVLVTLNDKIVEYNGQHKPSVDTPTQLLLYKKYSDINYMIHGHYYVEGADFTEHYNLCGDVKEVDSIDEVISKNGNITDGVINLKNHGFLIYSSTFPNLIKIINDSKFVKRDIGKDCITF